MADKLQAGDRVMFDALGQQYFFQRDAEFLFGDRGDRGFISLHDGPTSGILIVSLIATVTGLKYKEECHRGHTTTWVLVEP